VRPAAREPGAPLDCDIEIHASPRGKRTQRIHLLSSGERALVALSLLFGIFLTKPSPFCLLDEVDAPLDDQNIGRFVRMLNEFKQRTQFIVITHNPRTTTEAADAVYGVTMQEPGVSSLVSRMRGHGGRHRDGVRRRARRAALALLVAGGGAAGAQRVTVEGPAGNPITTAAGRFRCGPRASRRPTCRCSCACRWAPRPASTGLVADTTVPQRHRDRAAAAAARGGVCTGGPRAHGPRRGHPLEVTGPRTVSPRHLTLRSPNAPAGQSLNTRRPTFTWRSSSVPAPLAPWEYELRVEQAPQGTPAIIARTADTSFTAFTDLDANTSYRWRVLARFPASGEVVEVASAGSFVIRSDDAPLATLLYQNFPNPFPSPTADRTCLWFDLRAAGPVALDVLDLRGQPVKRLVPSARVRSPLPAGRYGRPSPGASSGCDPDSPGTARPRTDATVPAGVYLVRLRADGTETLTPDRLPRPLMRLTIGTGSAAPFPTACAPAHWVEAGACACCWTAATAPCTAARCSASPGATSPMWR
jgi:hypothetical protein